MTHSFLGYDGSASITHSPGKLWLVDIRKTDPWAYGSHGIHVIAMPRDADWADPPHGEFEVLSFDLHNDGASLGPWNLVSRWQGDSLLYMFAHGQEQADTVYKIDLPRERSAWRRKWLWGLAGTIAFSMILWGLIEAMLHVFRTPDKSQIAGASCEAGDAPLG
ncbi:MAG: hypothetical protein IPN71_05805 [Fibrobacteres bacterium]|nr:hypothetical protein [Fibrobacterota bacterium]